MRLKAELDSIKKLSSEAIPAATEAIHNVGVQVTAAITDLTKMMKEKATSSVPSTQQQAASGALAFGVNFLYQRVGVLESKIAETSTETQKGFSKLEDLLKNVLQGGARAQQPQALIDYTKLYPSY